VSAQHCLLTRRKIYPRNYQHMKPEGSQIFIPLNLPVHPRCERFIVVGSEANIEYWRSVLILLDQLAARFLVLCIIQVDMLIPRRHQ